MDISEEVLYSSLAQLSKKGIQELNKQFVKEQKAFEVINKNRIDLIILACIISSILII